MHGYGDGWEADLSLARFRWSCCHVSCHRAQVGKTPREIDTEAKPYPSCPKLTMSAS
jgi:putative transposase